MSATPDSRADSERLIADLQRQLAECKAERDEALQRETANAEVLQIINSSPGDLAPVFDAMLEKAMRLCGAAFGFMTVIDGERSRTVAARGVPATYAAFRERNPTPANAPIASRVRKGEPFIHTVDLKAERFYEEGEPQRRAIVDLGGARTLLAVPLMRDQAVLGAIQVYRTEVRPFSGKQIALLQNFAAQAVIAMENARLLGELRKRTEALTRRELALQDSEERYALAMRAINEGVYEWDVATSEMYYSPRVCELVGLQAPELQTMADWTDRIHPDDREGFKRAILAHFRGETDLLDAEYRYRHVDGSWHWARQHGIALKNASGRAYRVVGSTGDITDRKAAEEALREALEQQTATAEVLQVINRSPGDLGPVFDAILEKAHGLCGASLGSLFLYDGELFRAVAMRGTREPFAERLRRGHRASDAPAAQRLLAGERFVHIRDLAERDDPMWRAAVEQTGTHTLLFVPLRKADKLFGMIAAGRTEVQSYSDKEITLLENFAAQAVIAIENARLITETREALEQQTATAEVLQVINSSPGDLAPVFDAMLEKALRLCDASFGFLLIHAGDDRHRIAATRGLSPARVGAWGQGPLELGPGTASYRLVRGERFVHVSDAREAEGYLSKSPIWQSLVDIDGARTFLAVSLRKDGVLLGAFTIYRREVRPFTEKEIALVENFAAQPLIAMENARLLGELRERTRDLEESLEYQTATSDVLKIISRSTFDLQPVLDTLVETASRLCDADFGALSAREGDAYHVRATFALVPEFDQFLRGQFFTPSRATVTGRALLERQTVHIPDAAADPELVIPEAVSIGRLRTMLGVPLLREGEPLGVFVLSRQRVEPFTERQIELVRTFADQAVIAIENTRLITETREALEQQTATAEVLQVINSSPGDLTPVFGALLNKALTLCGGNSGFIRTYDGEAFHLGAMRGVPPEMTELLKQPRRPPFTGTALGRLVAGETVVEVANVGDQPGYHRTTTIRVMADAGIARTMLWVALRKEGALVGFISIFRNEIRPFSEKQIALLQNFAAQAVIAIDNARLLNEIRQRQAELRVTFDNMGDGVAMFDSELGLAAWNLNFQRILDVPDELLAERPSYSDYIRFLARRGEFGSADIEAELSRRLEGLGQELRFEHTRPDGRIIEVRRNAVPGGGFVIIYGDVTERKRTEGEIRAARDTAERALEELRTAQTSLVHAQKMAALGQLTAGIAHEIKNPLNFVNNFAELSGELLLELRQTTAPAVAALGKDERAAVDEVVEMLRGNIDKIAEHGKRADGIVRSMLEHSRGVSGERRTVDLNALIEEALNLAYHGARAQDASFNITLEREFDDSLVRTELAPQEMTRVFLNLFGNGFYATTKRQRDGAAPDFRPTLKVATRDLGDAVEVRVRDNGTGIAPDVRDKLFQPFVTTKPTGEGTGLGLSIAYDIVSQQHRGTIEVDSRVGEFTEFTIRLPRTRLTAAEAVS